MANKKMHMRAFFTVFIWTITAGLFMTPALPAQELTDTDIENLVQRSYQYVAMYNVNNKIAMDPGSPLSSGGWNHIDPKTTLMDHTLKSIARPNNDTLYVVAALDLTQEPIIIEAPAIDSKYVSLMVTGYDHYVNIPMSTGLGDFAKPSRILFYTDRTPGYGGEAVEGIDKVAKMAGDFVSALYRVMPHANEPNRLKRNLLAMRAIKVQKLSEYRTGTAAPSGPSPEFPPYGKTDLDVFENNLLEVMQFIFNHTTFDPKDELDQKLLAAYQPLGVVPGRTFDPSKVGNLDGTRVRRIADRVRAQNLALLNDPQAQREHISKVFRGKGQMTLDTLLVQSIVGPIGQPLSEAFYPPLTTKDGSPMNAQYDYVIRMTADELPPAKAFWSVTLYDTEHGFFLPNDRKKYSVGENAGMQLDQKGGITIHIAAERPPGVPLDNWLPVNRGDYGLSLIMRIYTPDLKRLKTWSPPAVERSTS